MTDLLDLVLATPELPFAVLHRPHTTGPSRLEVLVGEVSSVPTLADIPLGDPGPGPRTLAVVPYRQVRERGLECVDDEAPLLVMRVRDYAVLSKVDVLDRLPTRPIELSGTRFDLDDTTYADIVRKVITSEIGEGEGANFVIRRAFLAEIEDYAPAVALAFFRRLCEQEAGAYWTFVLHTGDRTFVGATPERHVSLAGGVATMNPISGTYRYPAGGPTVSGVLEFLADGKEIDELYMVLDEELKMMSRVCDGDIRVIGPRLKEMTRLAHTEYFIEGRSHSDVRQILRETMFAPTVTGSPVENACRVIKRHERRARGYYSGVAALIGNDESGRQSMDSAILIRTAEIDPAGHVEIGVGATLVRHSDPVSEVAETRAKLAALLSALQDRPLPLREHPEVEAALARRNNRLGSFWFTGGDPCPDVGKRALVIDAEDTFTSMIAHQLRALGLRVTVRRFDDDYSADGYDLVVLGPGPGDPRDVAHPKIAHLRSVVFSRLSRGEPLLAVCLSHQVLCSMLGLDLLRLPAPNQGVQREISLFGQRETVGFYNTFVAGSACDEDAHPLAGPIQISRDPSTGEVHALRGRAFASVQFHPESVLTADGPGIMSRLLAAVLPVAPVLQP
ncbi:anthranilate synthase family protein [Amycolatopsis sp. NPDC059657]|uniref:anthranilate synthase family protein n=1 Tax=Amycolatopsis sp. NPDC059657 TaxID=3346899 RepID=UPI00366EBB5A